jgi:hypothetical protein
MPTRKKSDMHPMQFTLSPAEVEYLRHLARRDFLSVTQVVRQMIREAMNTVSDVQPEPWLPKIEPIATLDDWRAMGYSSREEMEHMCS